MVKLFLKIQAELTNVTDLEPNSSPEKPYEFTFKIQCTKCRLIHEKLIQINQYEKHQIGDSRGDASFIFKCKDCKSEHSANVLPTNKKFTMEDYEKRVFVPILEIDARGLDFLEFEPTGDFKCTGIESGTKFDEVDLSDEWYDVDEKTNDEVSITEIKWSIDRQ
ncbi:Ess1 UPF0587 protein C2D10.03c [Candida maltosa Xu316]|uniref:DUF866-domain-containing protein n=1 Tax=Candida maltosa (strain Xu316) TaxID=1245528 RepID=M3HQR7_CANMX|nr:hypothetical protein G210_5313 [Candida maltosa Xu316]